MQQERPINLAITQFKFPLAALTSITHRITGLILFISVPFIFYLLDQALISKDNFAMVRDQWLSYQPVRLLMWVFLSTLAYHVCAGIRHILMDFGWFEGLKSSYWASWAVLGYAFILAVLAGIWLW